jgi:hypothetical protein
VAWFELRYRGPLVGLIVEWSPRDPFTVRLARLVRGDFQSSFDLVTSKASLRLARDRMYTNCRTMKRLGSRARSLCDGATYR